MRSTDSTSRRTRTPTVRYRPLAAPRREDAHAALGDGAHTELGLERHTQLAYDNDVERCIQRARDFECDGRTPAREPDDNRSVGSVVIQQLAETPGSCRSRNGRTTRLHSLDTRVIC